MRHLHFTQSLEPLNGGGLATSTVTLHRQLLAVGVPSRLCSTYRRAPQWLADGSLEFRRAGPDFLYFAPQLKLRAQELVADADVVHGHGLYVGTNYAFGQAARNQGKPLVYHVHGMFEPYILKRSRWKKRLVHWLFEDANFRHVRLWRALTQKEAEQIRACGIAAPIVIAPNGINLEDFAMPPCEATAISTPLIESLKKDRQRALFLGRIHPKKGLSLLLPAWAHLCRHLGHWELVVAGPDERGYLAEVRKLASDLGLESQVHFTGPVSGPTKSALLYSADLFILTSYSEGFPMGLLEAMACQIPVVASRACNFPAITTNEAGWECEASVSSVTQVLDVALSCSAQERKNRGHNGHVLVEQSYTWPRIINRLTEACAAFC